MNIKEALRAVANGYKGGARGLAKALSRSPQVFANKMNNLQPHEPTARDVIDVVNESGNTLPIQVMAHLCGGVFIQLPQTEFPADMDIVDGLAEYERDKGETMGEIATAMRAPRITVRHASEIIREGYEDFKWINTIGAHIYMMAEDKEKYPAMVKHWERLAIGSISA